jgi:dipeptidyl aminopeptidase/acylaminoacyl peptidase
MASGEYFDTRLWRIPVSGSGKASLIGSAGDGVCLPALAPGGRLAFSQRHKRVSIWSLDLTSSSQSGSRLRRWPASSSRIDTNPRFSPDGRRVAFGSTRTGTRQIWIANTDGSDALQLTSMAATFIDQPSWSPDGATIVFRTLKDEFFEFYTVSAAGGTPRRLVRGSTGDGWPGFSGDGRWIYFNSKRTGAYQIWRMPRQGGEAVQLTRGGGHGPRESADGRYIYFSRTAADGSDSLWCVPVGGGEETLVAESVLGLCFDLAPDGLYYVGTCGTDGLCPMYFYSIATGRRTRLAASSLPGDNGLTVSADGRTLLRGQVTELGADIMVLEGFR